MRGKPHAFAHHLPCIFSDHLPAYDQKVCQARWHKLLQAAGWILGRTANVRNLRDYIQGKRRISFDTEITPEQVAMIEGFDRFMLVTPPSYYDLQCLEGPLVHWEVLMLVARSPSPEQMLLWKGDSSPIATAQAGALSLPSGGSCQAKASVRH